jgi:8-hydroxy-5-deazaflavin:NADPH oxidoreductase
MLGDGSASDEGPSSSVSATTSAASTPNRASVKAIAAAAPAAAVYRAFNSLGWENFAEPMMDGMQADLLFAGPESHREEVERLIADIGLRPVYVGDLDKAPLVDALGGLWGALAFGQGMGRRLFFKVITPG